MGRGSRALVFAPPPNVPIPIQWSVVDKRVRVRLPPLAWNPPASGGGTHTGKHGHRLRVVQIRGDGRCLFRAIARGIAYAEERKLSESDEREDADALRAMAWKAMCVDRKKEYEALQIVEGDMNSYCGHMRSPSFYAGEAEMLALADALKIPIAVFLRDNRGGLRNIMTYGESHAKLRKRDMTVRVLYNGQNHYDAVFAA